MKKYAAVVLAAVLLLSCLFPAPVSAKTAELSVVTTIFPIYDWVRRIIGEVPGVEITLLLDSGVDLHSFQPTARDILKISACDLFIYVGGESDEWVEDALGTAAGVPSLSLLDAMGEFLKTEEIVEGMEHEHHDEEGEHPHGEEHEDGEEHAHEEEADEHVWLSLRNAQRLVRSIAEALAEIDAAHAQAYLANADAYILQLSALDGEYAAAVEAAAFDTLLFGDRFPFRYLTDDYGLTYYAAFSGCSAESEASFATIVFLAQKADELGLPAVMTIEHPKTRIAETVVNATKAKNQKILALDSMQSITLNDVNAGVTYLGIMENNLAVLKEALN